MEQPKIIVEKNRFKGDIALNYKLIKYAYPDYPIFSSEIIKTIMTYSSDSIKNVNIIEIGCGYGATTEDILSSCSSFNLIAIDNEPLMIEQAKEYLEKWNGIKQFSILEKDALLFLNSLKSDSIDIVVSELTIHNFNKHYRNLVLNEIYRVLVKGGVFVNSDKYSKESIKRAKAFCYEIMCFYKLLIPLSHYLTFFKWFIHHIVDQLPNRIMTLKESLREMKLLGFYDINMLYSGIIVSVISVKK